MKKTLLILTALMLMASVSACKDKTEVPRDSVTISGDIKHVVEDETKNEIEMADVSDNDLSQKIAKYNKDAVVQQTVNPGMKMLKVELPMDEANLPETFFGQVDKIVKSADLKSNKNFDYFYFSTSKDGKVQISVAFKAENDKFVLDSITGVGEEYENVADTAAKISSLFKK